jgi:hypothetical protein
MQKLDMYKNFYQKWFKEDKEFLSQKYNIINDLANFQCADFELNESESIKSTPSILQWNPIKNTNNENSNENKDNNKDNNIENKDNNNEYNDLKSENDNNHNIILKNKIISLTEEYMVLRSLGLEVKVSLLMSGESNFYIFSRCIQSEFSESTAVCCISKELESARKFISFAVLEKKKGEEKGYFIKNLKKQEIPHQNNHIKALDLSEISFVFIDNGDNKCFVFLNQQEQNSNLLLLGDFYEPIEEKCNVMLASSGDLISLKELEISQTQRDSYVNYRNMNNENIQCCQVF